MSDDAQPLGALAVAVLEKCCAAREARQPSPYTLQRRSVEAVQARRAISKAVNDLVAARDHATAAQFLREKLEQIEARS